MAKLSNYTRAVITSAIKKSNQRLAEISKHLPNKQGETDPITQKPTWIYSPLQKHEIAPFENDIYSKYLRESKSGNPTFDIRKILKDIESGDMDPSETNDFLVKAAGLRFGPDGEITPTESGGISTIKDLKKEAKELIKEDLPTNELLKRYANIVEIRDDFRYDYKDYEKEFGSDAIQNLPGYDNMKKSDTSYDEMMEFHDAMIKELGPRAKRAKNLGKSAIYPGNS